MEGLVYGLDRVGEVVGERVDDAALLLEALACYKGIDACGYVFLLLHKRYEHVLIGQFFAEILCVEAVEHVVVLYRRVGVDGTEAAMVVGEYESVWRNNDSRAEAGEVYDIVADSIGRIVEHVARKLEALVDHLVVDGIGQIEECPHAFVGMRSTERKETGEE